MTTPVSGSPNQCRAAIQRARTATLSCWRRAATWSLAGGGAAGLLAAAPVSGAPARDAAAVVLAAAGGVVADRFHRAAYEPALDGAYAADQLFALTGGHEGTPLPAAPVGTLREIRDALGTTANRAGTTARRYADGAAASSLVIGGAGGALLMNLASHPAKAASAMLIASGTSFIHHLCRTQGQENAVEAGVATNRLRQLPPAP